MNHLQKTKKRLTFAFLSIIIGIIVLLGLSFFMFRFVDGYRKDTEETKLMSSQERLVFQQLLNTGVFDVLQKLPKPPKRGGKFEKRAPLPFVVHFDSQGNVIEKDLGAEYEMEDLIQDLYEYKDYKAFKNSSGIGQFFDSYSGGKVLVFKPFRYPFFEYLEDVFVFLLFTLLFSIPLYFAIKFFVDKTLIPVEENLRDMEDFIHNAGHELKTPLSVVDGDLQIMKAKKMYDEVSVEEMRGELGKLNTLIEGLVDLANIHSSREKEVLYIDKELQEVCKTYDSIVQEKNICIEVSGKVFPVVEANKAYVQIFLGNLISNAIKYNIEGGKIFCTFNKNSLVIEDTGEGIDEEHHTKIWKRFYKVSTGKGGSGIGLSLVKKIAEMYAWKIRVESKKGHYTRFIITFN